MDADSAGRVLEMQESLFTDDPVCGLLELAAF
jgi:hypothetical protein